MDDMTKEIERLTKRFNQLLEQGISAHPHRDEMNRIANLLKKLGTVISVAAITYSIPQPSRVFVVNNEGETYLLTAEDLQRFKNATPSTVN